MFLLGGLFQSDMFTTQLLINSSNFSIWECHSAAQRKCGHLRWPNLYQKVEGQGKHRNIITQTVAPPAAASDSSAAGLANS